MIYPTTREEANAILDCIKLGLGNPPAKLITYCLILTGDLAGRQNGEAE